MTAAVIVFPRSNCDRDVAVAIEHVSGRKPQMVWHAASELPGGVDLVVLPGGFSYGDYLRCGAIAARSAIIPAVREAAERGVPVLGICNGFQILTEIGLLPGALIRNRNLDFICRDVALTVANDRSIFTQGYAVGQAIAVPVAHHDGNYFADAETLARIEGEGRVAFRYGEPVNGSARDIAGVLNERGNVLGLMPHPERRVEAAHGGTDGRRLFEALLGVVA